MTERANLINSIRRFGGNTLRQILPDTVQYDGITLPANHLRLYSSEIRDNKYYLTSAQLEADRLVKHFGLSLKSSVLDVGCGAGRLPIGILNRVGVINRYRGVDVNIKAVKWCHRNISKRYPSFQFVHLDVKNLRYNPNGKPLDAKFQLPFVDQEFNIIYLYSVFSHMTTEDIKLYLKEFHRVLTNTGKIFVTAFLEESSPEMVINPEGYRRIWNGPLHCVCYNKTFFINLLSEYGLKVDWFEYETELNGLSALCVSKL
jgi:ubiquinone/menaquinone biosynthesis C-methylase UbiE